MGNIEINQRSFYGSVSHTSEFGGHKWQEHGPWSQSKSAIFSNKEGGILQGGSSQHKLSVSGHESHHADAYDGPQGGGFPEPTGARDHYSYGISGSVVTVKVVSLEQINKFLPKEQQITPATVQEINKGSANSVDIPAILTATNFVNKNNLAEEIKITWNNSSLKEASIWLNEEPIIPQTDKELYLWAEQASNIATQNNDNVGLIPDNSNTDKGFWAKTKDGLVWVGGKVSDGAKFTAGVAIAAGATVAEVAEGTWTAVSHPVSTVAGVGETLAEGIWNAGESSYGLYKADDKIDYFLDGTVENFNTISGKISDKIEDTKANAAACGDDFVCKGAIYGKPITDTASYVIGGVAGVKTLGTVGRNFGKSADNLAEGVGKNTGNVGNIAPTPAIDTIPTSRPDFYVKPNGDVIPSTGYRYMSSKITEKTMETMDSGYGKDYFGFKKYNTGSEARDAYQIAPE